MASEPNPEVLEQLVEWRPPDGVVSVYLLTEPGDRSEGWRLALRDGLRPLIETDDGSHQRKLATRATVERILDRFPESSTPSGRCQIGFVEVSEKPGRELWSS